MARLTLCNILLSCKALPCLLSCLNLAENKLDLIEAAARALKAILHLPKVTSLEIYEPMHLKNLLSLLKVRTSTPIQGTTVPTLYTAELAGLILARSCTDTKRQNILVREGAVALLMNLLLSGSLKAQEAALEALSALCKENRLVGRHIVEFREPGRGTPIEILLDLARSMNPRMQLTAASCLTNLTCAEAIPEHMTHVMLIVLPTLIKLLDSSGDTQIEAPLILAYLVSDNEAMQKAACEADAIFKLADIISRLSTSGTNDPKLQVYQSHDKDKFEENALLALAAVSTLKEECRKQVIEAKALPHIVNAMAHPKIGIRAAACQCTRSLSRSVRNLRTSLLDAGVAEPLFKLLDDESVKVQISALATLCNIVLDFSPMKKHIIENGGVNRLVALVDSSNHQLRLNSVWALKNLLFHADPHDKSSVMDRLTYEKLFALMHDQEHTIQEQALGLLRNLSCGKDLVSFASRL
ncbi:hypothetical protein DSO57_1038293 [Entomophthora muscae]|uniref:Uncharacterized protein n=1 Tax=Entomophthora muscae TaxID=34485 RepID=A0ACC2SBS7_9FUNG|nr:hypothetical protein DSO57_1038293 [Entomophthora muscae]